MFLSFHRNDYDNMEIDLHELDSGNFSLNVTFKKGYCGVFNQSLFFKDKEEIMEFINTMTEALEKGQALLSYEEDEE